MVIVAGRTRNQLGTARAQGHAAAVADLDRVARAVIRGAGVVVGAVRLPLVFGAPLSLRATVGVHLEPATATDDVVAVAVLVGTGGAVTEGAQPVLGVVGDRTGVVAVRAERRPRRVDAAGEALAGERGAALAAIGGRAATDILVAGAGQHRRAVDGGRDAVVRVGDATHALRPEERERRRRVDTGARAHLGAQRADVDERQRLRGGAVARCRRRDCRQGQESRERCRAAVCETCSTHSPPVHRERARR